MRPAGQAEVVSAAGQGQGAELQEVAGCRVAQCVAVGAAIGVFVVDQAGDGRCAGGHRRRDHGVPAGQLAVHGGLHRFELAQHFDDADTRLFQAFAEARQHVGVDQFRLLLDQIAPAGISLGGDQTAALAHDLDRPLDLVDPGPSDLGASPLQLIDAGSHRPVDAGIDVLPQAVLDREQAFALERRTGEVGGDTPAQDGPDRVGVGNVMGQRTDRIEGRR